MAHISLKSQPGSALSVTKLVGVTWTFGPVAKVQISGNWFA